MYICIHQSHQKLFWRIWAKTESSCYQASSENFAVETINSKLKLNMINFGPKLSELWQKKII